MASEYDQELPQSQTTDQPTTQNTRPPDKSVYLKIVFLIAQQKHMLWVLKRSFEHPKHMFESMYKKIIAILRKLFLLN